jgi:hypothetical protein
MARLAGFFPSVDFTTVNGTTLVLQAYVQHQKRLWLQDSRPGVPVEVDLLTLIDEIVVGPKAQPWILELAHTVVQRYDLDLAVRSSELMGPVRERE